MPRHGENIFKRKDNRWEGRYISNYDNNGKAVYKSVYAKTYRDTKLKLESAKEQSNKITENQSIKLLEIYYTIGSSLIMRKIKAVRKINMNT